jgi:hypothetical protein
LYKFIATFENGDAGECNSTSTSPKWEIGKEYTYDLDLVPLMVIPILVLKVLKKQNRYPVIQMVVVLFY